jgi:hypothetical protein
MCAKWRLKLKISLPCLGREKRGLLTAYYVAYTPSIHLLRAPDPSLLFRTLYADLEWRPSVVIILSTSQQNVGFSIYSTLLPSHNRVPLTVGVTPTVGELPSLATGHGGGTILSRARWVEHPPSTAPNAVRRHPPCKRSQQR